MLNIASGFNRVNKTRARKFYNKGKTLFIVPCKIYPDFSAYWIKPFELTYTADMQQRDQEYPSIAFEHTFDSRINNFEYYNCIPEVGNYTAFYVLENK